MVFLTARGPRNFPIEVCLGQAATRTEMQVHFFHRYVRDTVIILEKGNLPQKRCPQCYIMVPGLALKGRHPETAQCAKGAESNL